MSKDTTGNAGSETPKCECCRLNLVAIQRMGIGLCGWCASITSEWERLKWSKHFPDTTEAPDGD